MSLFRISLFLIATASAVLTTVAQELPPPPPAVVAEALVAPSVDAAATPAPSAVETEIRSADDAYVAAFNAKDAGALAALWSSDAVYVDRTTGEEVVGRDAIAAEYSTLFERSPDLKIEVQAEAVQLLSPGVAVEHGTATFVAPNADPERIAFVAVWVKRDGKWLLDRVSDQASIDPSPHYEHLRELEWMVGEWVDEDDDATVETECRWTKNKNFLVREFAVSSGDEIEISGLQVIGWDASTKRLRSWTFDSDGGYAEGDWSTAGGRWYVRNQGYTSEGDLVTTTNVIRPIDEDSFGWRTIERIVEGEILPNVDETLVVRRR